MSRGVLTRLSRFKMARLSRQSLASALLMSLAFGTASVGFSDSAQSADLTWGGIYRAEAVKLVDSELGGPGDQSNKAYLLHHLVLTPKIVAADGLTIYSRFDLFNNSGFGLNNQAGQVFGSGVGGATPATINDSNVTSRTQKQENLAITTLYASWIQEFGQLVVGRVPMQFGLGVAYNAGNGVFDHYIDTRDLVGYKLVMGNLYFFPMLAKVSEGNLGEEDDVNDYLLQVEYDNPDTELSLGLMYTLRVSTFAGNDAPSAALGGTSVADGSKTTQWSIFASQKTGDVRIGVEANLLSGDSGVRNAGGGMISYNSYGVAAELGWEPTESKLKGVFKAGIASGDDPGTADSYEGYIFSRNYDVGMLLFNHPLGQADFFRTGLVRDTSGTGAGKPSNQIDTEAISNVVYFAPSLQYQWKENMSYGGTVVYGMLNKDPLQVSGTSAGTSTNLGFELDLNFTYKPYERLTWVTEAGFLFPGDAWKGGSNNFDNKFAYGLTTKAAISF